MATGGYSGLLQLLPEWKKVFFYYGKSSTYYNTCIDTLIIIKSTFWTNEMKLYNSLWHPWLSLYHGIEVGNHCEEEEEKKLGTQMTENVINFLKTI